MLIGIKTSVENHMMSLSHGASIYRGNQEELAAEGEPQQA